MANYTQLLMVQSHLKDVTEAAGGHSLYHNVLQAEVAITGLVAQVWKSDLGDKEDLVAYLKVFTTETLDAGWGLQHLGSRIGIAIDK